MRDRGIRVGLSSLLPLRAPDKWDRFKFQDKIGEVNQRLAQAAQDEPAFLFLDYHAVVRDASGQLAAECAMEDGTYLTFEAYRRIAEVVRPYLYFEAGSFGFSGVGGKANVRRMSMSGDISVGCYYFPNYHVDPRNEQVHGPGWTEWRLVKHATPRFRGHRQPLVPLWGYEDEAQPRVMEKKINAAADHGIDFWIFDWYWYDDGPYLERCLEEGYLKARNNQRVKFCCMWANHDWTNIHPLKTGVTPPVQYHGAVTPKTWKAIMTRVIERYFSHPAHFTIEGAPYFSFYDLNQWIASFGTVARARAALDDFRSRTRAAGFPGLHLNAVVWGQTILPGEKVPVDPARLVRDLGFNSVTSYVWVHHAGLPDFPTTPYEQIRDVYLKYWDEMRDQFGVPYFPNVTMGWDSSPRTVQSDVWGPGRGYPHGNLIGGNTPAAFRKALRIVRDRLAQQAGPRVVTLNAWNEWTEGSYLEPDTKHGLKYLEAIKGVFGAKAGVG